MPLPLTSPPIVEAVLEIRISQHGPVAEEAMVIATGEALPEYGNRQVDRVMVTEVKGAPNVKPTVETRDEGFQAVRVTTLDDKRSAYLGLERFAFSHFAPYPGWEVFRAEALRLWTFYAGSVRPAGVARLGLRTINRIPLAVDANGASDLQTVFTVSPQTQGIALQVRTGFFFAETFRVMGKAVESQLVRALEGGPNGPSAVIDIDVWQPIVLGDGVNVDTFLGEMRNIKNELFRKSVQEHLLVNL